MVWSILHRRNAAIDPQSTGEITQLITICPILYHCITSTPRAIIHAQTSPPITECVAETGLLVYVAILIQSAEPKRVASMMDMKTFGSSTHDASIIHHLIVFTTSPQAMIAHEASNIAAIMIAHPMVIAFDPTAGPILFATSFAHILRAI